MSFVVLERGPPSSPADSLLSSGDSSGAPMTPVRMERPVQAFTDSCLIGIMTVLMKRSLLLAKGGFDETLPRSEDYHLWLKCALDNDLWLLEREMALYRIHPNSLTHSKSPRFKHEEVMVGLLMKDPAYESFMPLLVRRLDLVMQDHCYF